MQAPIHTPEDTATALGVFFCLLWLVILIGFGCCLAASPGGFAAGEHEMADKRPLPTAAPFCYTFPVSTTPNRSHTHLI